MSFVAGLPGAGFFAASDVVGFVLFGVFLVAFSVLAVVTVAWAIRRDRAGRAEMTARAAGAAADQATERDPEER